MFNKKFKKYICISVGIVGTSFVGLKALAKYKKGSYIYQNSLKEQNPFEGKKVIFVNDENVKENADGVSGYLEEIGDSDFVPSFYDKYIKRTMDVVLSFGGLVVLSPVFAGVALAIMIEDPGPVFFTQKRVGQNKKYFTLHKFRSMKLSTPHDVPTHQLENPEQYITKIGKFIRAHSLDELPQIWDIFVGNMSVIGPRPALWNQDLLIAERDKYNANDVKPGLTGWAQINGRDELEIEEKARLDGEYVQKESLLFDTKCFIGTISKVGHDDSVVEGGTREMSEKKKWDFTTGKSKEELIGNIGFGEPVEVDRTQVKKVLITGAGSYIGEAFENYTRENYADNFQIDTVDMLDDIWRTKDFSKYDIVYHVAGIAHEKYIAVADVKDYAGTKPSGSCVVGGSSSVSPLMEKLIEAYKAVNPNASIELQTSDSTTGMTSTIEGSYDIGMASRELKEEEAAELEPTVIATDGIAVVVNNANPLDELSADQVKDIYVGNVSTWDEITK